MAEESKFLQVDNDWKKQAQEEKRKLAEKAQQEKAAAVAPPASATPAGAAASASAAARRGPGGEREAPPASFATLVQQLMTQAFFYLGEIAYRGQQPMLDLDMARHQHDLLTMLEQKTVNNLAADEQTFLDTALHEVRTRFIRAATEFITV